MSTTAAPTRVLPLVASALAALIALRIHPGVVVGLALLVALFVPLERLAPLRPSPVLRAGWVTDAVHFVVTGLLSTLLTGAAVVVVWLPLHLLVPGAVRGAVAAQPAWLQLVEALAVAEVGAYWMHRASHRVPLLWRFHRVHHSSPGLDWLAAARVHPVDQAVNRVGAFAPLLVLGFTGVSLGAAAGLPLVLGIGVHANVRLRIPVLRWVITTPEFHHWHHANQPEAIDRNFAAGLPILDVLFGTAHLPRHRAPLRYGIDEAVGNTWAEQMASPFRRAAT